MSYDQNLSDPVTFVVAPVSLLATLKGRQTARLVRLGEPLVERSGVPGRRLAFAHRFPADELVDVVARIATLNASIQILPVLPADWRWPPPPTLPA